MRGARVVLLAALTLLSGAAGSTAAALELVEVVKRVENSVVRIDTDAGLGSGVLIADSGLILTNYHVIEGAKRVDLIFRSGERRVCSGYLALDPQHDLAILRTEPVTAGTAIGLKNQLPSVGEKVAAFGNPRGFSFTTSEGIVSAIRKGHELQQINGDAYGSLGYSLDATWIQTTAAISGGNSGGPLVTMDCEVVGLNTWSVVGGQQLNFAISLVDIKRLLGGVNLSLPLKGWSTLPKARPEIAAVARPSLETFSLKFPTGRVFKFEVFITPEQTIHLSSEGRRDMVLIKHANGALFAAARQDGGVLNGLTVAQWDNREPMVHVMYVDGKRHGILKTWNEAGDLVQCCQYVNGKRSGFSVLFDDGLPVMVGQYKVDRIEYLQLLSGLTPGDGFSSEAEALKNPKAKSYLERQDKLDAELKKNEYQFRRQVKAFEDERRRDLAAKLSPEKKARAAQRVRERQQQSEQFIREMRRRTHGF